MNFDVLVLGAGGAGLMAAISASQRGKRVLLIEHQSKPGAKILVSGGGRCNFTNRGASAANYQSQNPHFAKSALARYRPQDFIGLVEKHKIPYHEKKLGQLFCDKSARAILEMLLQECKETGVEFSFGVEASRVRKEGKLFELSLGDRSVAAPALIVATGGLSFPKLGATDFGYRLARHFDIGLVKNSPALDGFVFGAKDRADFEGLSGLAAEAIVSCGGMRFQENILITHLGLSGPAILQASLYWQEGAEVLVNFCKELPRRLEQRLKLLGIVAEDWRFIPEKTVGYSKAEVTRGGIDTDELSSKTMESKKVPGLYFVGEVVDVTGQLGGYNFQWAWASGFAAGSAV
jgi:predicted Rossmann fold flavoprotein